MSRLTFSVNAELHDAFSIDPMHLPVIEAAGLSLDEYRGYEAYEMESALFSAIKNLMSSTDYYELWEPGLGTRLTEVLDCLNAVLDYVRDVPGAEIGWNEDAE